MEAQAPQTQKTCHVSANQSDITFSCGNGATWDRYVSAVVAPANNDEMHGYWLFAMPVTVSWDGHLLVNNGSDSRVASDAWRTSPTG